MPTSTPAAKHISLMWVCAVLLFGFASDSTATDKPGEISIFTGILYLILRVILTMVATGLLALAILLLKSFVEAIIRLFGNIREYFARNKQP